MGCNCGKPKCDGQCGCKSPAVLQINNPPEYITFHKVSIPAAMGDSTTNPPAIGKYKNVLLYYEADQTSWLYSTDGIPTKLTNGITNYEDAINLPQINGHTLIGNQSSSDLGIQGELTAGANIQINGNTISATDTTYTAGDGIEIDGTEIKAKIGDGLEFGNNGEINIADIEQYARFFDTVADMKASSNLIEGSYARTLGYHTKNDGGGALYRIRKVTNDDVVDESFIIEITADPQNTLVAELIYGSEINIKTLGCTTDISSDVDNASIINNAIQNKTKNIVIPSGEFIVKSPINVTRDETEIRGLGGSRIKADESTFTGTKVINVTGQYTKMNNLHVYCISANQTLIAIYIDGFNCYVDNAILSGTGEYGLYINKEEARIYNSKIRGFKNGVLIEAPDSYFEDIYIEQNTNNGFIAHIGSIEAHHIHSYYNGNRGFYMSNASHSNFYGLYADKNGGTSFELRNCGSCNFYACWAYYTGRTTSNSYGWQVVECYDTNFMGCKCQADQSGTTKSWLLYNSRSNLYGCTAENTNYQISGDNLNSFYSCAGYLAKLNGIDRSNLLIPLTTLTASTTTSLSIPLGKMPNIQDYNTRDYVAKINLRGATGIYSDLIVALISVGNNAPTRITQLNGDTHVVLTSPTVTVDANNMGTLSISAENLDSFNTGASGKLETNLTARGGE